MMNGIQGKTAIVTGSASGLGLASATRLAREGARVIMADISQSNLEKSIKTLKNEQLQVEPYLIDLYNLPAIDDMVREVAKNCGSIDILVNNAGVTVREYATKVSPEQYDHVLDLNLKSCFFLASAVAREMIARDTGGSIVNMSSIFYKTGIPLRSLYSISKAGVSGLTMSLGIELAPHNIRVNAVAAGYVLTDMVKGGIKDKVIDVDLITGMTPIKRLLKPEEIAGLICFLASSDASAITGETITIDGGLSVMAMPRKKE